jgi:hypothetical protein
VTKTFRVLEPQGLFREGAMAAVGGAIPLLLGGLVASEWLGGLAISALLWLAGWHHVGRQVREIRVADDGTVEFVRVRGRIRVAARDIRAVEGAKHRDEDGDVFWELRVRHSGRRIRVWNFERAEEFVADLRALNPSVAVTGEWPAATR